jgi:hypothetical protein
MGLWHEMLSKAVERDWSLFQEKGRKTGSRNGGHSVTCRGLSSATYEAMKWCSRSMYDMTCRNLRRSRMYSLSMCGYMSSHLSLVFCFMKDFGSGLSGTSIV